MEFPNFIHKIIWRERKTWKTTTEINNFIHLHYTIKAIQRRHLP